MNIVLSVYSENAFREYQLPALNNTDYQITLDKNFFHLKESLALNLEVLDKKWKLKKNPAYTVAKNQQEDREDFLEDNDVIQLSAQGKEKVGS